jgi:SAM-dependent methyltransferase
VSGGAPLRPIEEIRALIHERSDLPADRTEEIIRRRFQALPRRLVYAARRWPLTTARVLDVGCSYGHCLVHFGSGSVGLDNVAEHVAFCRSLGLDARLADVESGLAELEDGSFDAIWVSDILEHLDAPRVLLRRLAPKLRPDGRLVLYLTVLPRSRLTRRLFGGRGFFDADVHHYEFTLETASYLVERAGFVVEEIALNMVPRRLERLEPVLAPFAPAVYLAARPDRAAEEHALEAERRNRPS